VKDKPISFWQFLTKLLWPDIKPVLPAFAALVATLLLAAGIGYGLTVIGVSKDLQTGPLVLIVVVGVLVVFWLIVRSSTADSLDAQLKILASTLQDASTRASAIEAGIRTRQELLENLMARSNEYDQLAKVNQEAAAAVAKVVERAVGQRERRSLALNTLIAFVVGVVAGVFVEPVRTWIATLVHP
jgi:FtsH-binding integral membrane protein